MVSIGPVGGGGPSGEKDARVAGWSAWHGRRGKGRTGLGWPGLAGMVWRSAGRREEGGSGVAGMARHGWDWRGVAWQAWVGQARAGPARQA